MPSRRWNTQAALVLAFVISLLFTNERINAFCVNFGAEDSKCRAGAKAGQTKRLDPDLCLTSCPYRLPVARLYTVIKSITRMAESSNYDYLFKVRVTL
jgi:hypothetical protein